MSIFSRAQSVGLQIAANVAGESVTYARGAISIDVAGAIQGETVWDASRTDHVKIGTKSADWLIESRKLDNDGTLLTPARGDTITREDGVVFKVLPFGEQSQTWRYSDRNGREFFRIHTKEQ